MLKSPLSISLSPSERAELLLLARSYSHPYCLVQRARIILRLADQIPLAQIARELDAQRRIIRKWGQRYVAQRLDGLLDAPRSGRPARFSPCGPHPSGQAGV